MGNDPETIYHEIRRDIVTRFGVLLTREQAATALGLDCPDSVSAIPETALPRTYPTGHRRTVRYLAADIARLLVSRRVAPKAP